MRTGKRPAYARPVRVTITARPSPVGPRPPWPDLAVALVLTPLVVWAVLHVSWRATGFTAPDTAAVALTVMATMAVGWRRVAPLAALTVCTAAVVVATVLRYDVTDALPFVVCGLLLSLADSRDLPVALPGLGVALGGFGIVVASRPPGLDRSNVGWTFGLLTVFWVAGRLVRSRRGSLVARAAAAEERAGFEAGRAALVVSQERLRIARELHDILSHTVSVIAVQATVGEHLASTDPGAAQRCLGVIGTSAREALDELRQLLSVLRDDGPDGGGPPDGPPGTAAGIDAVTRDGPEVTSAPAHTLADIEPLVARVRATGLVVRLRTEGTARSLSPAAEACGYRIIQEALTNVLRHAADATADVVITYQPDAVELVVTDDGPGPSTVPPHPGHGLTGMRERAALFGGTLVAAGRPAGGFQVRARIPAPSAE